ncbi:MAG: hypothetical protein ACOC55_04000 [Candidatus Natronoplasma sp.]
MSEEKDKIEIKEGEISVIVPEHGGTTGPKKVGEEVFYNPSMRMNRDISISFLKSWDADLRALDGMAATGVRGLRILKETPISDVTVNDVSSDAVSLMKMNAERNDLREEITITNDSIERHLIENRYEYDYIDIDPFGTPVPYYPLAARYVSHRGIVGVSATDTSVLCGTYPRTCWRRYSVRPKNNWCRHENGLRILIAHCVREAARYDRWVEPLLSYYEGHHFRTYLRIGEGAKKSDNFLDKLKKVRFHEYWWEVVSEGSSGPFWTGRLHSDKVLEDLEQVGSLSEKMISIWNSESSLPPFFYDTNEISSFLGKEPPPVDQMIDRLKKRGFKASKTHFTSTGIKTDASHEDIKEIFLDS